MENAYLHKAVLNKAMTTQEWCVAIRFVVLLTKFLYLHHKWNHFE